MSEDGPAPLAPGTELVAGHEVLEHLNRGADLDVYDVFSARRACRCVAKTPRPDRAQDAAVRSRLTREGRLLARLAHPHLVRAYETHPGPPPVVILETLEGATLSHLIRERSRRLPVVDLCFLGLHLCSAVHYLHGEGWLHLDLKPSNVISDAGRARVIDLSLARRPGPGPRGVGTAQYLSPEQARGGTLGPAADVWGIGAVLWAAATGARPFGPALDGRYEQLERPAAPVRSLRRLPAGLASAIDASLAADPDARPALDDLSATLEDAAEGTGTLES